MARYDKLSMSEEAFLDDYKDFLQARTPGYEDGTVRSYTSMIRKLMRSGYTEAYMRVNIDEMIKDYSRGGAKDPKNHNQTANALKRLKEYFAAAPDPTVPTPTARRDASDRADHSSPVLLPCVGVDHDTNHVHYADGVPMEERVPGLCEFLEREYGNVIDFALSLLKELIDPDIQYLPVILSPLRPSRTYRNNESYVVHRIRSIVEQYGSITEEEIRNALGYTDRITGELVSKHAEQPYIILYYTQIQNDDWKEYTARIAQTFAHEYLHYLEFAYCRRHGRSAFQNKFVSEALADFFGVMFSVKRDNYCDLTAAYERYLLWRERFGSPWPYAYALYFFRVNGVEMNCFESPSDYVERDCMNKFRAVFEGTLVPKSALRTLQMA